LTEIRNKPSPEGYEVGKELARLCETQVEKYRGLGMAAPRRCNTCAYRAGTYANGCLPTVADALKCALENVPFECHEHRKEDPAPVCAGWMVMKGKAGEVKAPWNFVGDGSQSEANSGRGAP
jgi:hypothetical protein